MGVSSCFLLVSLVLEVVCIWPVVSASISSSLHSLRRLFLVPLGFSATFLAAFSVFELPLDFAGFITPCAVRVCLVLILVLTLFWLVGGLSSTALVLAIVSCTVQSLIQDRVVEASSLVVLSSRKGLGSSRQCESLERFDNEL
jgi:hypothetical protein